MKNNKIKISLLVCLFLVELLSLFLTYKSFLNKEIEKVKETYEVDKKAFSMFINDGNDNYTEYTSSNIFPEGYIININKSQCIDNKGNIIEGILSSSGNSVTVKSNTTTYCYLYFDEATAIDTILASAGNDLWESTLEDDGYRYVGTDPSNYICFGTTNQSDCMNNPDKYMYRIIGIFEDVEGTQHLKLIKKTSIGTWLWHSDSLTDTDWDESDLYNGINGSYFLSNTTYSYMQDTNWTNKIATWDYTTANTLTNESSGPDYNSETVTNVYLHEMNRDSKTSTIGEWKTVNAKIGLMYASDYLLSLGSGVLSYNSFDNQETLATGWMNIKNNDVTSYTEWTMSRFGAFGFADDGEGTTYSAYAIYDFGIIHYEYVDFSSEDYLARPVFYLTSDVTISGEGTSTNPYIIS